MNVSHPSISLILLAAACVAVQAGCGTTRSTDTSRTATEQLLISDAIDRAVQSVDVRTLAGQTVFLDDSQLGNVVDRHYLVSTLRQHLLASGCKLLDKRENADFIVEARAGAIGTDRNDLLFGVPSMNVPQIPLMQPVPAAIPEIPIAKRRDQRGIAKIAVFAYHRETGTPVWQSGVAHEQSSSNDVWILGAGPFQRGTIHDGTSFAGKTLHSDAASAESTTTPTVDLADASVFTSPEKLVQAEEEPEAAKVAQASHSAPEAKAEPEAPDADAKKAAEPPAKAAEAKSPVAVPVEAQPAVPESGSVYEPKPLPQPRFKSPG